MSLWNDLIAAYPELTDENFDPRSGQIHLKDDGDGIVYISKWEYSQPIPKGFKLGKPKA
jgi:hypothetical protein